MAKGVPPSIMKLEPDLQLILSRALGPATSSHLGPSAADVSVGKGREPSFAVSAAGGVSGRRSISRLPSGKADARASELLRSKSAPRKSVSKVDPSFYLAPLQLGRGSGGGGDGAAPSPSPVPARRSRTARHSVSGGSVAGFATINEGAAASPAPARKSRRFSTSSAAAEAAPSAGRVSVTSAAGAPAASADRQLRRSVTLGAEERPTSVSPGPQQQGARCLPLWCGSATWL